MPESEDPIAVPLDPRWTPDTVAVQAGRPARVPGAPMNPPITLSSTYVHDAAIEYGRDAGAAHDLLARGRLRPLGRCDWWRWGRVELPVQNPSPETTTSVSDGLSSTARTGIGTLPSGPVTCP